MEERGGERVIEGKGEKERERGENCRGREVGSWKGGKQGQWGQQDRCQPSGHVNSGYMTESGHNNQSC